MRFRYILPAALLTAGSAMAQAGAATPNALGVWNSNGFLNNCWYIGVGFPAGTAGNSMWQALPPELTTYFRNGSGLRELDFRGIELETAYFSGNANFYFPRIQIRDSVPNPANAQRYVLGPNIWVDVPAVPGFVSGGFPGFGIRIALDLGAGNAVAIPVNGTSGTNALMAVWQDFEIQYGDNATDLLPCSSLTEPTTGGIAAVSFSGGSTNTGLNFILPNIPVSGEFGWTWLVEQSVIEQVVGSSIISATGQILGGGAPPALFTVQMREGRGGVYPAIGDAISYKGNSSYGNPGPGGLSSTWFAPFVNFEGDNTGGDPLPETWSGGNAYIYNMSLAQWVDDFCLLSGACAPGTGAIITPVGARWGLWMGLDLANGYINISALLNGLVFADVSSFQWSGPISMMYHSTVNPTGLIGRNLVNTGGFILDNNGVGLTAITEYRTLLTGPQRGWTPVTVFNPPSQLGFGVHPGGAASGKSFGIQCWMIDLGITQVVDMTNVAISRLQ